LPEVAAKNALVSAATGLPVVSFQLKAIKQIEDKKITFHYNRSSATKRQYRPQGSFGLMFNDLKQDPESNEVDDETKLPIKYFVSVDLDHPFFRQFAVRVETISDETFDKFGLKSAIASIEYASGPKDTKHKELDFQAEGEKQKLFETYLNKNLELEYRQAFTFNFDPGTDWKGKTTTYRIPATGMEMSREGTIFLDPTKFLRFLEISVNTSEMVWDGVRSVDVFLECKDADNWSASKSFHLAPDTGDQSWKLRLNPRQQQTYTYSLVYNLADGSPAENRSGGNRRPNCAHRGPIKEEQTEGQGKSAYHQVGQRGVDSRQAQIHG
jgi:hypothetical protein